MSVLFARPWALSLSLDNGANFTKKSYNNFAEVRPAQSGGWGQAVAREAGAQEGREETAGGRAQGTKGGGSIVWVYVYTVWMYVFYTLAINCLG